VADVPAHVQFALLQERFVAASSEAKARPPSACAAAAGGPQTLGGAPLNPVWRRAQGLLLTTYMKLLVADPGDAALREGVQAVFERYARCAAARPAPSISRSPGAPAPSAPARCTRRFMDADLQQRAAEYLAIGQRPDVAARNVAAMPPWEKRKSLLLRRMAEREARAPPGRPRRARVRRGDADSARGLAGRGRGRGAGAAGLAAG